MYNYSWEKKILACHTVVLAGIKDYPILFSKLLNLHHVVKDGIFVGRVVACRCLAKLHEIDVHVGGAHTEFADMFIERIAFKPHRTKEGDCGKLVVEDVFAVDDPDTYENKN